MDTLEKKKCSPCLKKFTTVAKNIFGCLFGLICCLPCICYIVHEEKNRKKE